MILESPYPDVDIPDVSLTEYVLGRAGERGDKPALIDGATGAVTTFAELERRVGATAAALAADGLGKGDVIGLLGPNSADWAVAYHAAVRLGVVVSAINPLLTPGEAATQLTHAGAKAAIAAGPLQAGVREAGIESCYALESLPEAGPAPPAASIDPARDLAALPFSSGTTGLSKGVMLTHRNLVANMEQIGALHPLGDDDVLVGILPFFHIYGQIVVLNAGLAEGATIVTLSRFDMGAFLRMIGEHRVTRAHVAPPVVLGLANAPAVADADLSSLRFVMSGAAPLDAALSRRASERVGCPLIQGYGMTEASPVTHLTPLDEELPPDSVGRLVPCTEGRIEEGELWVRGPQVMLGYLNDEGASAATIVEDGWLRTGDVVTVEDGCFYVVDRVKELIKYKGYQVAPAELEAVLVGHPAILDAAVIGVPDEEAGEAPKAFVVSEESVDGEELKAWVAAKVAPYKRIRHVEQIEQIPKSPSGKILRRILVQSERERAAGAA